MTAWAARRLERIPAHGKIAGVCAGIANYLDMDVALVRALWVLLSLVPGTLIGGVLAYAAAWLLMPVLGITGVALAWLVVQTVGAVVLLARERRTRTA